MYSGFNKLVHVVVTRIGGCAVHVSSFRPSLEVDPSVSRMKLSARLSADRNKR